ncbi:lysozyme inhibitor LprI family protein [Burkholderia vietnamiensis]|uniref:lysozyme inhibitor LprI family protein n=1 Tax=Burkholderia vietnamiensis TaxID=60552 RepID=UPI0009BD8335|nr:lysozyme inhibitor LprI family protein [Burkholderia vietnamiensis]
MNITKKAITLVFIALPAIAFADATINNGNVYDDLSRINAELNKSKTELNSTYQKLYLSTRYKNELQQAQEAWLAYRSKQCTGYVAAEAAASQGIGSSLITKECLTTITKQRVDYLKTLLQK